jgi:PAS domain S-box-containing protein
MSYLNNRKAIFIFSLLAYTLLFQLIARREGHGAILALLPVLTVALCWGWRAGLAAGFCAFPVNMFMMTVAGLDWKPGMLTSVGIIGHIAFIIEGAFVGWIRDLYLERQQFNELLQQEMARRDRDMELLRSAEQRLQAIIQESVDAIVITGKMMSQITMVNSAFLELVGCTAEEALRGSFFDFMPVFEKRYETVLGDEMVVDEQMYAEMLARMSELADHGRVSNWEFFLLNSSGLAVSLEANAVYFHNGQGEREGAAVVFRDITQRKRSERRLQQANERLQQEIAERARDFETLQSTQERLAIIIEQSGEGIFISDSMDMRFQMCNKAFCDLVGFDRADLTGESIFNLLPEIGKRYMTTMGDEIAIDNAFYEKSRPMMGLLQEQGMISNWELSFVNRDQKLVPVEINIKYMYNERKEFVAAVSIVRDITQRKLFERQLQDAKDFLENIIETSLDGILISDSKGHIISVNQACTDFMGYDASDLLGLTPVSFTFFDEGWYETTQGEQVHVSMADMTAAYSRMDEFFKAGKITNYIFYIKRKDGRLAEVEANIAMLYSQKGEAVGSVSIMRDITARKRMEHELVRQRDQLAAANRELESFSYSVSHDLRAPLRSISGFSAAIEDDFGESLPPEVMRYFERIRAASGRMGLLIDDLLKLSRLTRYEMRRETVNLSALASEIATHLQEQEPGRTVIWDIQPNLVVRGDGRLLRIALENLLGNAWKYTGTRERAEIFFGLDGAEQAQEARGKTAYCVRDNGVGFDMAYAGKLFGAFQRLHAEREFPGTGIGLATVQRIVHRHGGRVWAHAAVDGGATFCFTLAQEG